LKSAPCRRCEEVRRAEEKPTEGSSGEQAEGTAEKAILTNAERCRRYREKDIVAYRMKNRERMRKKRGCQK
jgi:hypothetical protein